MRNSNPREEAVIKRLLLALGRRPNTHEIFAMMLEDFADMQDGMIRVMSNFALRDDGKGGKEKRDVEEFGERVMYHFDQRVTHAIEDNATFKECPGLELKMSIMMKVWFELCAQVTSKLVKDNEFITAKFAKTQTQPAGSDASDDTEISEDVISI